MSDNNKSYRIRTNVGSDSVLNVNLNQDFNVLEVLSLKIGTDNLYRFHTSDYGCIAGRVLANGNFGIPNAKISIFIAIDSADTEDDIISYLYPYKTTATRNSDKIRYNLLPEEQLSDCHRNVGTFPSKRTVLDDNHILEVYDKYYKYTTRSNESGDYMIFGVPTGAQTLHVDIDLSDIGILSQRPRDMIYKGYNITQFENGNMFKKSNDLDSLAQIISQNQSVYVYPFWGDESEGEIAITRRDIEIQYEFTSTCVFIGSLITDEASNGISKRCIPSERMGKMDRLTTGNGTIEMIRKKADGSVEEVSIQGNTLIDGNGTWCYQIPMNLDYVRTDEYGNTVPTDDPNKGIATRACVRFRFSLTEFENEGGYSHVSKVLVPHNPQYYSNAERGNNDGAVLDYVFGTNTDDASFKNLFLNNVYTVKSFIPRFQMINIDRNKRFSGIKAVNVNNGNNPIPYNNIRVDLTFMFTLQCATFRTLLWIIGIWNWFISKLFSYDDGGSWFQNLRNTLKQGRCIYIGEGYCPEMEGWYFAPNCTNTTVLKKTHGYIINQGNFDDENAGVVDENSIDQQNRETGKVCLTTQIDNFIQCTEINLAMEYDVIQFDFYNDWMNGMIYAPRWFADIRPKRSYLFGLVRTKPRVRGCMEDNDLMFSRRYVQQCALTYSTPANGTDYTVVTTPKGCNSLNNAAQRCHKAGGRQNIKIFTKSSRPNAGVVHDESVANNNVAYYFRPCEWLQNGKKCNLFATDIVLLGNLEKNNLYGIPQTFEKMTATSYQMPDTLASTNMGFEGFLYGNTGSTSVCNGTTTKPARRLDETKSAIVNWTRGKDYFEGDPYDEEESLLTESSGIDWGFWGPDQGKNDLDKLYFPGGHFLGVSCVNSETNIKSCVNLSRICEMGSMISQRHTLIASNNSGGYVYKHTIPTGLISGEGINDHGFKNEFATLNYNGLKIKRNKETLLYEYDFETVFPFNFNGELSGYTQYASDNSNPYNNYGTDYKRTIEENSRDYYRFRLGLPANHTKQDAEKKYLISANNGSTVALPVYENSFYFYFGLKNGSTSLDRFFKEFYAECPSLHDYEPGVSIEVIKKSDYCENNGKLSVTLKNIEDPTCVITYLGHSITTSFIGTHTFENLPGGRDIFITINGGNISTISRTVVIPLNYPESISSIEYAGTDYTEEYPDKHTGSGGGIGYITFNGSAFEDRDVFGIGVYTKDITENNMPMMRLIENRAYRGMRPSDINAFYLISDTTVVSLDNQIVYGWAGNTEYSIAVWYACGSNVRYDELGVITLNMPAALDIIFGGNRYASYNNLVKPMINAGVPSAETMWYQYLLNYSNSSYEPYRGVVMSYIGAENYTSAIETLEREFAYRTHISELYELNGGIDYEIVGGEPPYQWTLSGSGEQIAISESATLLRLREFYDEQSAANAGFNLSVSDFLLPIGNVSVLPGYRFDYALPFGKIDYQFTNIKEASNKYIIPKLNIRSSYMPFFFRALCLEYYNASEWTDYRNCIKFAVANPMGTSITVNGNGVIKRKTCTNTNRFSIISMGITAETKYNTVIPDTLYGTSVATNGSRLFSVTDKYDTIKDEIDTAFIGDFNMVNGNPVYFAYDERVRYYVVTKSFIDKFITGSTVYAATGGTNYIPYDVMGNSLLFSYSSSDGYTVAGAISGWSPITQTIIMDGENIIFVDNLHPTYKVALRKIMGVESEISESTIRDTSKTVSGSYVMGIYCSNYTVDDDWITRASAYTISASTYYVNQGYCYQYIENYTTSEGRSNISDAAAVLDNKRYTVNPRHKSSSIIIRFYKTATFNDLKNNKIPR